MKKRNIVIFIVVLIIAGALGSFAGNKFVQLKYLAQQNIPNKVEQSKDLPEEFAQLKYTYDMIKQHYYEDVDEKELLEGAIQGMLEKLDDPYSSYMNKDAMEQFNDQISASFQGIGAEVSLVDGKVTIIAPIKESPAEKVGLRPNDVILQVNDESLDGLDLNEAVSKIRGEKGTEAVLLIERASVSKPFEVTVVRDDIPVETVKSSIERIDGKKTGIIEITSFAETTAEEFAELLELLEADEIDGLVIDVRGNPGGLLNSIEDILKHFVPSDIPYFQTEDRDGKISKYYTNLAEKKPYPISVVIDEGSASASEILAVAMKEIDYDIVGETSFGKGTVQQTVPISKGNDGLIKLTFYKWLSPKGNWIHDIGVEPTVKQKQPDFYYTHPIILEGKFVLDDNDEQIKNVQTMLKGLNYNIEREDGYFDVGTKAAIEKLQKDHDLPVTGELDEQTANVIQTEILDLIRSAEQDVQLQKAIEILYK